MMTKLGFIGSCSTPCCYYHPQWDVRVVAHVGDFLCVGPKHKLEDLSTQLSQHYSLKREILGPHQPVQQTVFLGRTIRWTPTGITYEADPKHVSILREDWDLQPKDGYNTPGTKGSKKQGEETPLEAQEAYNYRRTAARLNYLTLTDLTWHMRAKKCFVLCHHQQLWACRNYSEQSST